VVVGPFFTAPVRVDNVVAAFLDLSRDRPDVVLECNFAGREIHHVVKDRDTANDSLSFQNFVRTYASVPDETSEHVFYPSFGEMMLGIYKRYIAENAQDLGSTIAMTRNMVVASLSFNLTLLRQLDFRLTF
jgi:hypothetical protein